MESLRLFWRFDRAALKAQLILLSFFIVPLHLRAEEQTLSIKQEEKKEAETKIFSDEELKISAIRLKRRQLFAEAVSIFKVQDKTKYDSIIRELELNDKNSPEYFYFLALRSYRDGDRGHALLRLKKSIEQDSRFDLALNMIGVLYIEAKQTEAAKPYFQKAVMISPYNPTYEYNLGLVQFRTGKPQEAIELVSKAIYLKANFAEAYYLQGQILNYLKNEIAAFRAFANAERFGMDSPDFYLDFLNSARLNKNDATILRIGEILEKRSETSSLRAAASIRYEFGEFSRVYRIMERFSQRPDATLSDWKLFLETAYRIGKDPYNLLTQFQATAEEKLALKSHIQIIIQDSEKSFSRDPIINHDE